MKALRRRFRSKLKKKMIYEYLKKDELNIELIMKEYTNYIYTIIKNSANSMSLEDIEEIISDVFLSLWNNRDKLDIEKELSPYIAGITKNLIKKKYRNNKVHENIEDYEEKLISLENIELYSEEEEQNEILIKELGLLKLEEQKIFMMFYYEDKKVKEIAQTLEITQSKVKMKLHRIRKKLKENLKGGM